MDAGFSSKIILSDEAHFHLDGFVNRQNCRFWGTENPHVIVEKQMHPQRVTVWCGFWAGGIIGPYFFENEAGQAVTVTGARYRYMITQFFLPKYYNGRPRPQNDATKSVSTSSSLRCSLRRYGYHLRGMKMASRYRTPDSRRQYGLNRSKGLGPSCGTTLLRLSSI
ncbi:hypothetical protein ALC56_09120 [Trachymyrmex septentrionalis]|uniref:Uncharacterized protein n=1 Tax=Trachymyrmex septentrionalis TaxID=34720 RepID=A0A151JUS7_9HYME|nr:hypothetical protein ALC56_09120 [Trachymyrmex septentrionalis]